MSVAIASELDIDEDEACGWETGADLVDAADDGADDGAGNKMTDGLVLRRLFNAAIISVIF